MTVQSFSQRLCSFGRGWERGFICNPKDQPTKIVALDSKDSFVEALGSQRTIVRPVTSVSG